MIETELAWAAGLFDGEGSVSVNARTKALEISVGQKGRTVLDRFQAAVGVGRVYEYARDEPGGGTFFHYAVPNARHQLVLLRKLWPYLSEPKRDQARRAHAKLAEVRAELERQVADVVLAYEEMEGVMSS